MSEQPDLREITRLLEDTEWIESPEGQAWLEALNKKMDEQRRRRTIEDCE